MALVDLMDQRDVEDVAVEDQRVVKPVDDAEEQPLLRLTIVRTCMHRSRQMLLLMFSRLSPRCTWLTISRKRLSTSWYPIATATSMF